jgi:ABC-type uncharacterized transport system permease subunit
VADSLALYLRLVGAQVRSQLQYRLSFTLDALASFTNTFVDFLQVLDGRRRRVHERVHLRR